MSSQSSSNTRKTRSSAKAQQQQGAEQATAEQSQPKEGRRRSKNGKQPSERSSAAQKPAQTEPEEENTRNDQPPPYEDFYLIRILFENWTSDLPESMTECDDTDYTYVLGRQRLFLHDREELLESKVSQLPPLEDTESRALQALHIRAREVTISWNEAQRPLCDYLLSAANQSDLHHLLAHIDDAIWDLLGDSPTLSDAATRTRLLMELTPIASRPNVIKHMPRLRSLLEQSVLSSLLVPQFFDGPYNLRNQPLIWDVLSRSGSLPEEKYLFVSVMNIVAKAQPAMTVTQVKTLFKVLLLPEALDLPILIEPGKSVHKNPSVTEMLPKFVLHARVARFTSAADVSLPTMFGLRLASLLSFAALYIENKLGMSIRVNATTLDSPSTNNENPDRFFLHTGVGINWKLPLASLWEVLLRLHRLPQIDAPSHRDPFSWFRLLVPLACGRRFGCELELRGRNKCMSDVIWGNHLILEADMPEISLLARGHRATPQVMDLAQRWYRVWMWQWVGFVFLLNDSTSFRPATKKKEKASSKSKLKNDSGDDEDYDDNNDNDNDNNNDSGDDNDKEDSSSVNRSKAKKNKTSKRTTTDETSLQKKKKTKTAEKEGVSKNSKSKKATTEAISTRKKKDKGKQRKDEGSEDSGSEVC